MTSRVDFEDMTIADKNYGRTNPRACRGVPAEGGRRRLENPPDPSATLEIPHSINVFVRRGVDHDKASTPSPLDATADRGGATGAGFTFGAQRGASQVLRRMEHDGDEVDAAKSGSRSSNGEAAS